MRSLLVFLTGGVTAGCFLYFLRLVGVFTSLDAAIGQLLGAGATVVVAQDGALLIGLLMCFWMAWIVVDVPTASIRWCIGAGLLLLLATGTGILTLYKVSFPASAPMIGAMAGLVFTSIAARIGPGAQQRKIAQVFDGAVGSRQLRLLRENWDPQDAEGERMEVAVLVLRAACHELMEVLKPAEYAKLSHTYLEMASDYLVEVGGYLDGAGGQNLRVVFGVPFAEESPAATASRAAVELSNRLGKLNIEVDSKWHHVMEFHIGIATGNVIGGMFGVNRGMAYTVAGDPVELAPRLAAACESYGCKIMICPDTYQAAADIIEVRPMDLVQISSGRKLEIFEILGLKKTLSPERLKSRDHFWRGVIYCRKGLWDDAVEELTKARIKGIPDPPLDYYLHRVERERQMSAERAMPLSSFRDLSVI